MNRTSAHCNQAIMFITDGIEGEYAGKATFDKHNKKKRVRVFSYLVGRIKNPAKEALIKMSCDNHGHFYKIETLGNIWDTVLDYLRVMSRPLIPMPHDKDKPPEYSLIPSYTPAYLDSAGFGMVMTISMNAFKRKKKDPPSKRTSPGDSTVNPNLVEYEAFLGVVGTDISLDNLKDKVDVSEMGCFSRGFIINNNGFVLIHPNFRGQSGYLPTPPNVLLDEIELSVEPDSLANLKEEMLAQLTKGVVYMSDKIETRSLYDNGRKVYTGKTQYWYKAVQGTDLVSAIALSQADTKYLTIETPRSPTAEAYYKQGIKALKVPVDDFDYAANNMTKSNTSYVTIAPWNYCTIPVKEKPLGVKNYPTAQELHDFLEQNSDSIEKHCSPKLIERLLVMAGAVDEVTTEIWDKIVNDNSDYIEGMFVATSSGFQKYMAFHNDTLSSPTTPYDRDVVRTTLFETVKALPTDIPLFLSASNKNNFRNVNDTRKVTAFYPIKEKGEIAAGKYFLSFHSLYSISSTDIKGFSLITVT